MIISNDSKPDAKLAAFRLPKQLLAAVDVVCLRDDMTRSQLFRRCITEFVTRNGLTVDVPERGWSPELYKRRFR